MRDRSARAVEVVLLTVSSRAGRTCLNIVQGDGTEMTYVLAQHGLDNVRESLTVPPRERGYPTVAYQDTQFGVSLCLMEWWL